LFEVTFLFLLAFDDWGKRLAGEEAKLKYQKRVHKKLREEKRLRMRERAALANAAEERGDKTRKMATLNSQPLDF
jgi:hypothetical protein